MHSKGGGWFQQTEVAPPKGVRQGVNDTCGLGGGKETRQIAQISAEYPPIIHKLND